MLQGRLAAAMALLVVVMLYGCGTMNISELVPDAQLPQKAFECDKSSAEKGLLATLPQDEQLKVDLAKEETVKQVAALKNLFDVQVVSNRIDDVKTKLPEQLRNEPVVKELLRGIGASVYQAQSNIVEEVKLSKDLLPQSAGENLAAPKKLDEWDFRSFTKTMRQVMFSSPMSFGAKPVTTVKVKDIDSAKGIELDEFERAFVEYFSAYYQGKYYDRFGVVLPKPALSRTIGNTEIAGAVQVFLELLMDYVLRTPVWQDTDENYHPGTVSKKTPPTAVETNLAPVLHLVTDPKKCGITKLKADAIEYLASLAADQASTVGGLIGGSFGGLHFGLGVLGKLSIGDNQTLQVLVKTMLAKTFERAGEEISYRLLYWVPYNEGDKIADIVQKYLDSKQKK